MKRIFIALKVSEDENFIKLISVLKSALSKESIKWINPGNTHITLAFLGDTDEKLLVPLGTMLKDKCEGSGRFELTLKGFGIFRNLGDPRILWTGIEQSEALVSLAGKIAKGLSETGIITENRPFTPHLTIGRIKHIGDKSSLKALLEKFQDTLIQKVPVNEVLLYESLLKPSGSVYKVLAVYSL